MKTRVQIVVAYDGATFPGWQSQADKRAVQDHLERAASTICKGKVTIHGAGRTDAGVHALAQSAHFETGGLALSPAAWVRAFNANLPPEIRVLRAREVPERFHARFSAKGKIYRYQIVTTPVLLPMHHRRAWHLPTGLDLTILRESLDLFQGTHDFRPFSANRPKRVENTVRTIHSIQCRRQGGSIFITVRGDGFLYKMVRMVVAASVRVAQGKETTGWITRLLDNPTGEKNTHVAPADGLNLVRVVYGD